MKGTLRIAIVLNSTKIVSEKEMYKFIMYKKCRKFLDSLKVVSATFLLVCLVCLTECTSSEQRDVIKCLSMKHETHFNE